MSDDRFRKSVHRCQIAGIIVGIVGLLICLVAGFFVLERAFQAYWFAWVFWTNLSLGALSLLMLVFLTGGAWAYVAQRPAEAAATTLPLVAVALVPALFGMPAIFEWAKPGAFIDHEWPHKQAYLTVGWFAFRSFGYFVIVLSIMAAVRYLAWLSEQRTRLLNPTSLLTLACGLGTTVFVACMLFASTDWVMSLQPDWKSSMFAVIFMATGFLGALALVIGVITLGSGQEPFASVLERKPLLDLGNLLLAFVVFWTYVSFSQFLLIWIGNLPKEISWYLARQSREWKGVALLMTVLQFATPFVLLLARKNKSYPKRLSAIAWMIFAATVVNVYWLVVPSFRHSGLEGLWLDIAAFLGIGGIWIAVFLWVFGRRSFLPHLSLQPEERHD